MDCTPSDVKRKIFENKATEKKSFISKSLSVIDMMKLGKLIRSKERSSAKVLTEKLNMENNEQSFSKEAIDFRDDPAMFWIHKGTRNTNAQDKLGYCQTSKPE